MATPKTTPLYQTKDPVLVPGKTYTIVIKVAADGTATTSLVEIEPNQVFTINDQGQLVCVKPVTVPNQ